MGETLRIAGVVKESIVDGKGLRFVVFCQGCPHNCPGCHNPNTHDFSGGYDIDIEKIVEEIKKNPLLQGVTFSGGEPFCQAKAFTDLARRIKAIRGMKLDIMSYSGYTFEELTEMSKESPEIMELLKECDYLVDGRFVLEKRDLLLKYRGSSNQRYIDLNKTFREGKVVPASEKEKPARERYR